MNSAYVYAISIAAALAGLLFGFDTAVINGALVFLKAQMGWTDPQLETAAGSLLLGCLAGSAFAGTLTDRWGRRRLLITAAVVFCGSSIWTALPSTLVEFLAARFSAGLAIGVASVLAPMYIAEVSPPALRGRLVTLNQMAIVSGILLSYLVNWMLAGLGHGSWRWMFASAAIPSIAFFLALLWVPESPRWLMQKGRAAEALRILTRIAGAREAGSESAAICASLRQGAGSFRDLLAPALRRPLGLAIALAVLSQITGINTVIYYGALIFQQHGGRSGASDALGANIAIGVVNFAATLVAIAFIDKLGRKPLLMAGSAGMCCALVALSVAMSIRPVPANLILGLVLFYVTSFAVSLGPGSWLYIAELFPTEVRGRAMSIATLCLWAACSLVTMTFLTLTSSVGTTGAFLFYGALCGVAFLFVWKLLPETKGRTLEEITVDLSGRTVPVAEPTRR